jgi:hypothetical protein
MGQDTRYLLNTPGKMASLTPVIRSVVSDLGQSRMLEYAAPEFLTSASFRSSDHRIVNAPDKRWPRTG